MKRKGFIAIVCVPSCIALYLIAAVVGASVSNTPPASPQSTQQHTIVLVNGPIHYDILLPVQTVRQTMSWLADHGIALDHPDVKWVTFGWGAKDFYTNTGTYADISARAIGRAVTGDAAVMHISVAGVLEKEWHRVSMSDAQMSRMVAALESSFANGSDTEPLNHVGFSHFDRFFAATGRFHLFNTCNVWVGEMIRQAGLRFGFWTPTPYAVTLSHRLYLSP